MIELDLAELVAWVLGVAFLVVAGSACRARWSERKEEKRALRSRCECRICLAVFEDTGRGDPVVCPSCGAQVRRGPSRALG